MMRRLAVCGVGASTHTAEFYVEAPISANPILPLLFYNRLRDVFDDEIAHVGARFPRPGRAEV
jgi:hypothetical protein